jgi:Putative restriction endonuclease
MEQMTKLVTADDLWNMPDHGGRNELVNGELRPMSPAGGEHGAVIMYIAVPMANHAEEHDQGIVLASETGFILRRSPDTVRAADAAFVRKDRIPAGGIPVQFIPFAPNLAVEVMSPWDTMPERSGALSRCIAHRPTSPFSPTRTISTAKTSCPASGCRSPASSVERTAFALAARIPVHYDRAA